MVTLAAPSGWLARNPSPSAIEIVGPGVLFWDDLRSLRLTLPGVRPVIHLAHRLRGPLEVRDRVVLDHEFLLILDGNGEIKLRNAVRGFSSGDLFAIAPFVPHRFACYSETFEHIAIHFRFGPELPPLHELHAQVPYRLLFADGHDLTPHVHLGPAHPLRASLEQIVRFWAEDTPIATLKAEALLMSSVAQLLRRPNDDEGPSVRNMDPRIAEALRLFEQRPAESLQISELAAAANLGVTHFNLLFRECTNETPAAYMRRLRTNRARKLLEDTDLPVKAIALTNGFRDSSHFSRTFFKLCGSWPTEYRKAAQTNLRPQAKRRNRGA